MYVHTCVCIHVVSFMCPLLLACNYIRTRMCGNPVHLITDSMASHHKMIITGLILSIAMQWTLSTGKELLLFKVKEWQYIMDYTRSKHDATGL